MSPLTFLDGQAQWQINEIIILQQALQSETTHNDFIKYVSILLRKLSKSIQCFIKRRRDNVVGYVNMV